MLRVATRTCPTKYAADETFAQSKRPSRAQRLEEEHLATLPWRVVYVSDSLTVKIRAPCCHFVCLTCHFRGSTWLSASQGGEFMSLPTYAEDFLDQKPSALFIGVHGRPAGKFSLGVTITDVAEREMAAHMPLGWHRE